MLKLSPSGSRHPSPKRDRLMLAVTICRPFLFSATGSAEADPLLAHQQSRHSGRRQMVRSVTVRAAACARQIEEPQNRWDRFGLDSHFGSPGRNYCWSKGRPALCSTIARATELPRSDKRLHSARVLQARSLRTSEPVTGTRLQTCSSSPGAPAVPPPGAPAICSSMASDTVTASIELPPLKTTTGRQAGWCRTQR